LETLFSFFFCGIGFKLMALHLLGKSFTTWVMPTALFVLLIFSDRVLGFCLGPASDGLSYLCLQHSWNYRCGPSCLAFFFFF
jgi:hypothetical protein